MFIRRGDDKQGQPVLILGLTFDDLATLKEEAILEISLDGTGYPGKVSLFCAPSDADMLSAMDPKLCSKRTKAGAQEKSRWIGRHA